MRTAGIFAAIALSFASLHTRADTSKAWTAAKAGLPADAKIVVGVDLIQKTQMFTPFYPKLLEKADASKVIDTMKATCKIDPLTTVQGRVVALSGDQQDGAVYLGLSGIDKAKLSSCLETAIQDKTDRDKANPSKADKPVKASIKQDGNITQVSNGTDTAFIGWVGKDVSVVSLHAEDKTSLVKWMGGKGALAKSELGKRLGKLNISAMMWGAGEATKEIEPGVTVKGGYGAVTFAKGNLAADVHAVMASADQAAKLATSTKKQLDEAKQGQLPPAIVAMLKSVTIAPANDEIVVKASVVEKDLLAIDTRNLRRCVYAVYPLRMRDIANLRGAGYSAILARSLDTPNVDVFGYILMQGTQGSSYAFVLPFQAAGMNPSGAPQVLYNAKFWIDSLAPGTFLYAAVFYLGTICPHEPARERFGS